MSTGVCDAPVAGTRLALRSKPVAMTVIFTLPTRFGSTTAPKMMLASSCAASWITHDASFTSMSDRSDPPVTLMISPRAPFTELSSSSGLEMARWAACIARPSPSAMPVPIIATPIPDMIVFTSAKSRLIRPGTRIRSEMPCIAWRSTSAASVNASVRLVLRSMMPSSRSFGIVMTVSTHSRSASSPASACIARFFPSNRNGLVTTATVSAPSSLARLAMTGAAPVPVPPPSPVVTKIMSAPESAWMIVSVSSSAACRPMFGSAPAPSPFVSLCPIWTLTGALLKSSACTSVLATMNSTPPSPTSTMRLTALHPPPPTPTTLILAPRRDSGSSISRSFSASRPLGPLSSVILSSSRSPCCFPESRERYASKEFLENPAQPPRHAAERACADARMLRYTIAMRVEHQPDRCGKRRAVHVIGQTAHAHRASAADRQIENLLGDLGHAFQNRPAAGHDDSGVQRFLVARAPNLVPLQVEDLLRARLQDLGQDAPRHQSRLPSANARHFDCLVFVNHRRQRTAVLALDFFRVRDRRAQADGDDVREMVAANRHDAGMPQAAPLEDCEVRRSSADVDQSHPELFLVWRDDGFRRRQLLDDRVHHGHAGTVDAGDDVLRRRHRSSDDVDVHFEPGTRHSQRRADAVLFVNDEVLRQHMEDLPSGRKRHGFR